MSRSHLRNATEPADKKLPVRTNTPTSPTPKHHRLPIAVGVILTIVAMTGNPVVASDTNGATALSANDVIEAPRYVPSDGPDLFGSLASATVDPLGLISYPDETRRYSTGSDRFEVWECPDEGSVPLTASAFVAGAEARMTEYFSWLSSGRYDPDFVVGGVVPSGQDCSTWARSHSTGSANAALFIRNASGGYSGPGYTCAGSSFICPTKYPDNRREGYIGVASSSMWTILAHEIGHMLSWPHSKTGQSGSPYDNAIDVMSGNYNYWSEGFRQFWGTYYEPYATVAINRYGAGWFDPEDVVIWDGGEVVVTLTEIGGEGIEALVIDAGTVYYVLGTRASSGMDPFPGAWDGVEVYEVERCPDCWGLNGRIKPIPAVPFVLSDLDSYDRPLPHVLRAGSSVVVGEATVTVQQRSGNSFTVSITSNASSGGSAFIDVPIGHPFLDDIEWLASEGITKGCNPPGNTRFCPDSVVTRGQMAAFLVRALDLPSTAQDFFSDDGESIFEADINRLAAAGITKGCNSPNSDRYCPESKVTRAQMAAFIARALGYSNDGGGDLFEDDDTSIFEHDIDLLGTAGVTKGCNPPTNNMFCPDNYVTRSQMAAFLHRALG